VLLVALLGVMIGGIFIVKGGYIEIRSSIFTLSSCWSYLRAFFEVFGIQVYFLWILQTQKRTVLVQKKKVIIFGTTTTILISSLVFVAVAYLSINVNVDYSKGQLEDPLAVL
jgi:hypothetical protein